MPRRKTIRAAKRATPRTHGEQVGANLTGESKADKLDVLLKDFDQEVELRLKELSSYYEHLLIDVEKMYLFEHHRLPKAVLTKKYIQFCESGCSANMVQFEEQHQDLIELLKPVRARARTDRKAKAVPQLMDTIAEDGQNFEPLTKLRLKPSKTGAVSRKSRKVAETPTNQAHQRAGWDTPLQTPAFASILPQTPALAASSARRIRPGESLFLISANGSPIQLENAPVIFGPDESSARIGSISVLNQDAYLRINGSKI